MPSGVTKVIPINMPASQKIAAKSKHTNTKVKNPIINSSSIFINGENGHIRKKSDVTYIIIQILVKCNIQYRTLHNIKRNLLK